MNQELKEVFGDYLYWSPENGKLKLKARSLAAKLSTVDLRAEIKVSIATLKEDIQNRLQELEGITQQELSSYYKKFRDYPLVILDQDFEDAIKELQEEEKILLDIEKGTLHLSPLLRVEERINEFENLETEQELAYFVRDNLFTKDYKILAYDKIEDSPDLKYLLLLKDPEIELEEFLKQELYNGLEFQNSIVLLRPKEKIYIAKILEKIKRIMAVEEFLNQNNKLDLSEEILLDLKAELIKTLEDKFAYYEHWTQSETGLELVEKEVPISEIPEGLEMDKNDLKEDLKNRLRAKEKGITKEKLFIEYRQNRGYPLVIKQDYFEQAMEELIAEKKIITTKDSNEIYGNSSALIKSTVDEIDSQEAKQELVLYIRNELFNGEYNVFAYDQLEDKPEMNYLLLLGSFKNKEKLQQILERKIYQDREYRNNIAFYGSRDNVFEEEYVDKMKVVMGVERAQEKINWAESKIDNILNRRKEKFNQELKDLFGDYIYWQKKDGEWELQFKELEAKLSKAELKEEIKADLEELKADISRRLQELNGIKAQELLANYYKFRDYPLVVDEGEFYQALEELEAEDKVFVEAESNTVHISPILLAEDRVNEFKRAEVKRELSYLLRNHFFDANYKIFNYDQVEDRPELDYLLLFATPDKNIRELLEKEIYNGLEFANSVLVLRVREDVYTDEVLTKTKKLMAVQELQQEELEISEEIIMKLKEELLQLIEITTVYYQQWVIDEQELQIEEKEIAVAELPEVLELDFNDLKKDLVTHLRARKVGVRKEELFLDYRRNRGYRVVLKKDKFEQALEELIAEGKIISAEENSEVYGNTSALIKSSVAKVDDKEAKQRLVLYIRNQLFNEEYNIFGYDQLEDTSEVKHLLLLGSFKNKAKLKEILEMKLYQEREYENTILLYSSQEDVFKEKYLNKMKLVMGIEKAQEKINWSENKIDKILDRRRGQLNEKLKSIFGNYFYWHEEEGELKLDAVELNDKLTTAELRAEIQISLEELKRDINNRLRGLEGIVSAKLLDYYKKMRGYTVILDEEQFYQALKELKYEKRIVSENDKLYSNLESLVEAKYDQISKKEAQVSLVRYIKEEVFSADYKIYGYDTIPDNAEFKKVILLNYFAKKDKLKQYLLEELYQGRQYKGTIALLAPKDNLNEHIELVKKVIAIEKINTENELVNKLLKVTESKLIQKLEKSFANYLNWHDHNSSLELDVRGFHLEEINKVIKTDKTKIKEYIISHVEDRIKIADLLEQLRKRLATPILESDDIFYEIIAKLFDEDQLLLMTQEEELYQGAGETITGDMFIVDPEFEFAQNEESETSAENSSDEVAAVEEETITAEKEKIEDEENNKEEQNLEENDKELEEDNYEILDLFL
ncbi:hypothetical protein [Halanaerobacter jeridensis]|uniref:Uncharacterized protein n=1 Tax=Halanaerobacter jeridensis TaxID=706427 RepID=A0A938XRX7_9FIRM|nr:hypothetical protein [Halanaerobacter jeridensis]MBM7555709.1 hypothetical protein [Halanaerobacter jeridensis]